MFNWSSCFMFLLVLDKFNWMDKISFWLKERHQSRGKYWKNLTWSLIMRTWRTTGNFAVNGLKNTWLEIDRSRFPLLVEISACTSLMNNLIADIICTSYFPNFLLRWSTMTMGLIWGLCLGWWVLWFLHPMYSFIPYFHSNVLE